MGHHDAGCCPQIHGPVLHVSGTESIGIDTFLEAIASAAMKLPHLTLTGVPGTYAALQEALSEAGDDMVSRGEVS